MKTNGKNDKTLISLAAAAIGLAFGYMLMSGKEKPPAQPPPEPKPEPKPEPWSVRQPPAPAKQPPAGTQASMPGGAPLGKKVADEATEGLGPGKAAPPPDYTKAPAADVQKWVLDQWAKDPANPENKPGDGGAIAKATETAASTEPWGGGKSKGEGGGGGKSKG